MKNSKSSGSVKYWCFISYRHADNKDQDRTWASWLHQEIERYDVPAELVGTENNRGDFIPERIYPVFRDEDSLSADAHLASRIQDALENSFYLVLLCSPRSVASRYVNDEICYFLDAGREERIIPAIIDGEPGDPERECFPAPLRHRVDKSGKVDLNAGPLAADFRLPDGSEGFTSAEAYRLQLNNLPKREAERLAEAYEAQLQLMKLKIIAGVLGVPLETLRDRDKAWQLQLAKKRARALRRILVTVSLLALAALAGGWLSVIQARRAQDSTAKARVEAGQAFLLRGENARQDNHYLDALFHDARAVGFESLGKPMSNGRAFSLAGIQFTDWRFWEDRERDNFPRLLPVDRFPELSNDAYFRIDTNPARPYVWQFPPPGRRGDAYFGPDGKLFVTVHTKDSGVESILPRKSGYSVYLWDLGTGRRKLLQQGFLASPARVLINLPAAPVFSPDGSRIAFGTEQDGAVVLDASSWQKQFSLPAEKGRITALSFSRDSRLLAVADESSEVRVWDCEGQTEKFRLQRLNSVINRLTFLADGNLFSQSEPDNKLVCGIRYWDISSGAVVDQSVVAPVVSSPEGFFAGSTSFAKGELRDVRLEGSQLELDGYISAAAFSPDGQTFVWADGNRIKRADIRWEGSKRVWQLAAPFSAAASSASLHFSPNGRLLVAEHEISGGFPGGISVRNFSRGTEIVQYPLAKVMGFSPDGQTLVTDNNFLDLSVAKPRLTIRCGEGLAVSFSPDGTRLCVQEKHRLQLFDTRTGIKIGSLNMPGIEALMNSGAGDFYTPGHRSLVNNLWPDFHPPVSWSDDGRTISARLTIPFIGMDGVYYDDEFVAAWDTKSQETDGAVFWLDKWTATGAGHKLFARGAGDGLSVGIGLVNRLEKPPGINIESSEPVEKIVFDSSSRLVAVATANQVEIWDRKSGGETGRFSLAPGRQVKDMIFSPAGDRLICNCISGDESIPNMNSVLYAVDGREITTLDERGRVTEFSDDGKLVAGFNFSRQILIWDAIEGSSKTPIDLPSSAFSIVPGPNSLVAVDSEVGILVYDMISRRLLRTIEAKPDSRILAWSPDGKTLACLEGREGTRVVKLWGVKAGRPDLAGCVSEGRCSWDLKNQKWVWKKVDFDPAQEMPVAFRGVAQGSSLEVLQRPVKDQEKIWFLYLNMLDSKNWNSADIYFRRLTEAQRRIADETIGEALRQLSRMDESKLKLAAKFTDKLPGSFFEAAIPGEHFGYCNSVDWLRFQLRSIPDPRARDTIFLKTLLHKMDAGTLPVGDLPKWLAGFDWSARSVEEKQIFCLVTGKHLGIANLTPAQAAPVLAVIPGGSGAATAKNAAGSQILHQAIIESPDWRGIKAGLEKRSAIAQEDRDDWGDFSLPDLFLVASACQHDKRPINSEQLEEVVKPLHKAASQHVTGSKEVVVSANAFRILFICGDLYSRADRKDLLITLCDELRELAKSKAMTLNPVFEFELNRLSNLTQ
ncbi:MAG: TIR domain-containing protein [Verrucomicrobiales bacterium]|nr:TIR domain-containing protein [Verrucomicrobiales bacterium]